MRTPCRKEKFCCRGRAPVVQLREFRSERVGEGDVRKRSTFACNSDKIRQPVVGLGFGMIPSCRRMKGGGKKKIALGGYLFGAALSLATRRSKMPSALGVF